MTGALGVGLFGPSSLNPASRHPGPSSRTYGALRVPGTLFSVSCSPNGRQCVAVGFDTAHPASPSGLIVRFDRRGIESVYKHFPSAIFQAVTCARTQCFATGHNSDDGLLARVPLRPGMPPKVVDNKALRDGSLGIACVSNTDCVADSNVLSHGRRPYATVNFADNGHVASSHGTFAGFLYGIACRGRQCFAVGDRSKKPPTQASVPGGAEIEVVNTASHRLSRTTLAKLPALVSISCPTPHGSCYALGPSDHPKTYVVVTLHPNGTTTVTRKPSELASISCTEKGCFVLRVAGYHTDIASLGGRVLVSQSNQLLSLHCTNWGCVAVGGTNKGKTYIIRTG